MGSRRSAADDGARSLEDALWAHHHAEMRDPLGVVAQWHPPSEIDPRLLEHEERGDFWGAVAATGETLLVTREYEHLVAAFHVSARGKRRLSLLRLPHPSGIAVDARGGAVHIASTRNPNALFTMCPATQFLSRAGDAPPRGLETALRPVRCTYLPGATYVHDLAMIGGRLHANAVGMNAVVRVEASGALAPVFWPRSIDGPRGGAPRHERNYLQLNSIAAGRDVAGSFFTASSERPSARRPGHRNYPVDRRGVVFSGRTREVVARGLTRPHSARLAAGELWVDDSGYGAVGRVAEGRLEPLARLRGWTRGLCVRGRTLFAGTSRVLPRFRHYAPGLDAARSECAIVALDLATGAEIGALVWPRGNQIFAIELTGPVETIGFPFAPGERGAEERVRRLFSTGISSRG